jgi:ABC-type multidrug transport system fused ATPase/permease subunit
MVIVGKISAVFTFKEQSILSEAGGVAEEVLSAIKTVIAFGGETREMNRYTSLLNMAKVESYKKQITVAFAYGFYTLIFFSFYTLGIW